MFEKAGGSAPNHLFHVTKVDSVVTLAQACSYADEARVVEVPAEVIASHWLVFKGDPPVKMFHSQCKYSYQFELDAMKASLYTALFAADNETMNANSSDALIFYRRPDVLYPGRETPKGALTLVPMAPLSSLGIKESVLSVSLGEHTVGEEQKEFIVAPPHKPHLYSLSPDHIEHEDSLIGFWWVGTIIS